MTEKTEPRKFSLKLEEESICIVDRDGKEKAYTMYGLSGKERARYLNAVNEHVQVIDGKITVDDFEGLEENLLCKCLRDERKELVTFEVLQDYPSTTLSDLFELANKLSGLDRCAKAAAKKD